MEILYITLELKTQLIVTLNYPVYLKFWSLFILHSSRPFNDYRDPNAARRIKIPKNMKILYQTSLNDSMKKILMISKHFSTQL